MGTTTKAGSDGSDDHGSPTKNPTNSTTGNGDSSATTTKAGSDGSDDHGSTTKSPTNSTTGDGDSSATTTTTGSDDETTTEVCERKLRKVHFVADMIISKHEDNEITFEPIAHEHDGDEITTTLKANQQEAEPCDHCKKAHVKFDMHLELDLCPGKYNLL